MLVVGDGTDGNNDYLYHPGTDSWTAANTNHEGQWYHTATLLTTGPNAGQVLILGGQLNDGTTSSSAVLYDPVNDSPTVVTGLLRRVSGIRPRYCPTATC